MSDSIWRRGIPDSLLTRRNAYAVGILFGVTVVLLFSGYAWIKKRVTEPAQAPACFGEARVFPPEESRIVAANARQQRNQVDEYTRRDGDYATKVKTAMSTCTTAHCDSKAWSAYRSALFWYFSERMRHMQRPNLIHGEPGVRASRQTYLTNLDREIDAGIRERYRARLFRLNDITDQEQREAMTIIIFKGAAALQPCGRPHPSVVPPGR